MYLTDTRFLLWCCDPRQGQWAEVEVDEGDGPLYNATPTPSTLQGWSTPLLVDKREGVHVGGSPEYVGVSLYTVHHDFHDGKTSRFLSIHLNYQSSMCWAVLLLHLSQYLLENVTDHLLVFSFFSLLFK